MLALHPLFLETSDEKGVGRAEGGNKQFPRATDNDLLRARAKIVSGKLRIGESIFSSYRFFFASCRSNFAAQDPEVVISARGARAPRAFSPARGTFP